MDEPPSWYTLAGWAAFYFLFVAARATLVVSAARARGNGPRGDGALPAPLVNALYFGEMVLVIAVSFTAARFITSAVPAAPLPAAWLAAAVALLFLRAAARVVLPASAAAILGRFLLPVARLFQGLLFPLFWLARAGARLVAAVTKPSVAVGAIAPAAEAMAAEKGDGEPLGEEEREMIDGIISIRDTVAREVMVPRVDMVTADLRDSLDDIKRLAIAKGFSRIPVIDESPDDVVGILHAKDIFRLEETGADVRSVLRKPTFVPESKKVNELLSEFRAAKSQLAIVVDEYGGTAGLITLEDVIEEIVGEIHDEYDTEVKLLEKVRDNEWLVAGRMDIGELNEELGTAVPEEEFETVAGFVSHLSGKVPAVGEVLTFDGLRFEVVAADDRRVQQVRLTALQVEPPGGKD